jgi:hypothetical protein
MDDIIYSYTAEDAESDGILHNITNILANDAVTVRITSGIKDYLLSGDLEETDESYKARVREIAHLAITKLKNSDGDWLATFKFKVEKSHAEVWACVDTTSGPAIHILFLEEY